MFIYTHYVWELCNYNHIFLCEKNNTNANICGHMCKQMNKILFCKKKILLHMSNINVFMFAEKKWNLILQNNILLHKWCLSKRWGTYVPTYVLHKSYLCANICQTYVTRNAHIWNIYDKHMRNMCRTYVVLYTEHMYTYARICVEKYFYICKIICNLCNKIFFMQNDLI